MPVAVAGSGPNGVSVRAINQNHEGSLKTDNARALQFAVVVSGETFCVLSTRKMIMQRLERALSKWTASFLN